MVQLDDVIISNSVVLIQRSFRHFLNGRRLRNNMKYKHKNIWKLKSFAVRCALDKDAYLSCKNNREYVDKVYNSIQVFIHQDSDDEEDYSLSEQQITIINELKKKPHIYNIDIKNMLKGLTLDQLQFIQ
jgi:hypothetical protein